MSTFSREMMKAVLFAILATALLTTVNHAFAIYPCTTEESRDLDIQAIFIDGVEYASGKDYDYEAELWPDSATLFAIEQDPEKLRLHVQPKIGKILMEPVEE